jgi:hypothetical protein
MPLSLSGFAKGASAGSGAYQRAPVDKSKFDLFKPLSLDVIFHDCEITDAIQGNFDAFA